MTTRLKPEFAHNPEHYFLPFYYQKMDCSGVRYLSYESVKNSFDITLLKWKALLLLLLPLLLLHDFCTTA